MARGTKESQTALVCTQPLGNHAGKCVCVRIKDHRMNPSKVLTGKMRRNTQLGFWPLINCVIKTLKNKGGGGREKEIRALGQKATKRVV